MSNFRKTVLAAAASIIMMAGIHANASTILNFEDLAGGQKYASIRSGYMGIQWDANFWAYDALQSPFDAASGQTRIASNGASAGNSSFSFKGAVNFEGATFAGATAVGFRLFYQNLLVHTSSLLNLDDAPTFLNSGYSGAVDKVQIIGGNGYYVLDDLVFTSPFDLGLAPPDISDAARPGEAEIMLPADFPDTPPVGQVPEPAMLTLLGLGLLGAGVARRNPLKRKRG